MTLGEPDCGASFMQSCETNYQYLKFSRYQDEGSQKKAEISENSASIIHGRVPVRPRLGRNPLSSAFRLQHQCIAEVEGLADLEVWRGDSALYQIMQVWLNILLAADQQAPILLSSYSHRMISLVQLGVS